MEIKDLITDLEILQECLELVEDTTVNKAAVSNHDGEDKEIVCKLCGKTFIFTPGEQEFYKSKNFPDPKCCKKCAKKRRMKFLRHKGDK